MLSNKDQKKPEYYPRLIYPYFFKASIDFFI
jgi:hypothetical protein